MESIRMIAWLMITPARAITPRIEVKDKDCPVRVRPISTPINDSGTAESR
jgi:hypothetical protein